MDPLRLEDPPPRPNRLHVPTGLDLELDPLVPLREVPRDRLEQPVDRVLGPNRHPDGTRNRRTPKYSASVIPSSLKYPPSARSASGARVKRGQRRPGFWQRSLACTGGSFYQWRPTWPRNRGKQRD